MQQERQVRREPQQGDRRIFTVIGTPHVGDYIAVRTLAGVKGLVCKARNIIACLASGDKIQFSWQQRQPPCLEKLGLSQPPISATFKNEGTIRDSFVLDDGRIIPVAELTRSVNMRVLYIAPRDHVHEPEPEYNDDAIRGLLDSTPLPAARSCSGELVHV